MHVLLHGRPRDGAGRAVVAQINHLRPAAGQFKVDGRHRTVVPVTDGNCGQEPQGRAAPGAAWGRRNGHGPKVSRSAPGANFKPASLGPLLRWDVSGPIVTAHETPRLFWAGPTLNCNVPMIDLLFDEHSLWRDQVSPAESAFLEKVRLFAEKSVAPHADEWERAEELPRSIFEEAGRIGLMGVTVPKKFGGRGFGYATYALAIREIARYQGALAIDIAAHNALAVGHILSQGSPAQHKKVFPRLVNGKWIGAWALTEPEAGSDSGGVQTTGTQTAAGTWELNGFKRFITLGRARRTRSWSWPRPA